MTLHDPIFNPVKKTKINSDVLKTLEDLGVPVPLSALAGADDAYAFGQNSGVPTINAANMLRVTCGGFGEPKIPALVDQKLKLCLPVAI